MNAPSGPASGANNSRSLGQKAANTVSNVGKKAANTVSSLGSTFGSMLGFSSSASASGAVSGAVPVPGMATAPTTGGARRTRRLRNMRGRFLSKAKAAKLSRKASSRKTSSRAVAGHKMATVGTKAQVYHGTAKHTSGGLTKADLMYTKKGRIVSRRKHAAGKKALQRLRKAGYKAKKGTFRLFHK